MLGVAREQILFCATHFYDLSFAMSPTPARTCCRWPFQSIIMIRLLAEPRFDLNETRFPEDRTDQRPAE